MNSLLEIMKSRLTEEDALFLKEIYEPVKVAVPPADAVRDLMVMPDGEIRHYGADHKKNHLDQGRLIYLSSKDCGLSWKKHLADVNTIGSSKYLPEYDMFISAVNGRETRFDVAERNGLYAAVTYGKVQTSDISFNKITDLDITVTRQIIALEKKKRIILTAEYTEEHGNSALYRPFFAYSDDGGKNWRTMLLEPAPPFEIKPPHKGTRWQNQSCEPTVVELSDGTLLMHVRTSQDYHYKYYSYDHGESWTGPVPSEFHATLTMPTTLKLSDGRILMFWCNTQPLPEMDLKAYTPALDESALSGRWEDVFTNRDVNHAAISEDDGKTWIGCREIVLNPIRNYSDFRSIGGSQETMDKSVHQFEAVELPFGKVLLSYGQHPLSRGMVIFDPAWLYEKERKEDFRNGLANVSTHVYVKSLSGGYKGFSGHCAWNRTHGAMLVNDPDGMFEEALQISRIRDPRLFSEIQGVVWNFPASFKGHVKVLFRIKGSGIRVSLTDRWFNPIDTTIADDAQITVTLTKELKLNENEWSELKISWDARKMQYTAMVNDKVISSGSIRHKLPLGLSYLHIQSLAVEPDSLGTYIKKFEKQDD